ncbi:MAG: hypothetical protein ACRERE_17505 [Candidatus Entotheonellia bacterium]
MTTLTALALMLALASPALAGTTRCTGRMDPRTRQVEVRCR